MPFLEGPLALFQRALDGEYDLAKDRELFTFTYTNTETHETANFTLVKRHIKYLVSTRTVLAIVQPGTNDYSFTLGKIERDWSIDKEGRNIFQAIRSDNTSGSTAPGIVRTAIKACIENGTIDEWWSSDVLEQQGKKMYRGLLGESRQPTSPITVKRIGKRFLVEKRPSQL